MKTTASVYMKTGWAKSIWIPSPETAPPNLAAVAATFSSMATSSDSGTFIKGTSMSRNITGLPGWLRQP